jgi:hypothetical protein
MYTNLNSGVMYVRRSVNGKLAHECVVFGTLMPRFSCRGVACAERQSETNFPKNTSKRTQRLDVYYTRRNTTPSCRGHRPCGSKRVVSQKYAGKMVVAIAHHLVGKKRQTDRWRRTPLLPQARQLASLEANSLRSTPSRLLLRPTKAGKRPIRTTRTSSCCCGSRAAVDAVAGSSGQ